MGDWEKSTTYVPGFVIALSQISNLIMVYPVNVSTSADATDSLGPLSTGAAAGYLLTLEESDENEEPLGHICSGNWRWPSWCTDAH